MNVKSTKCKLLITLVILLLATVIISAGCQKEREQRPASSTVGELSKTLVPNTDLDLYLYVEQDKPTILPSDIINAPFDVVAESLAIWGIPMKDDFAFGGGLTLTSTDDASKIYSQITPERGTWIALSGSTIYFVQGSGIAAKTLKKAISNKDFKYYDDRESLQEAAALPDGRTAKLAAVAIAKPSKALLGYITEGTGFEPSGLINFILKLARLEVIVGGLYSPHQIDVAEIAKAAEQQDNNGSIWEPDLGMLISVKSGLPGFIVRPIVRRLLDEGDFTEINLGELTLYKGFLDTDNDKTIPVLVRIEGNRVFAAISGQQGYAQTLITSINR